MKITRYIRWFDKVDDSFAGESVLPIATEELQRFFSVSSDNPMYDCWQIEPKHAQFFLSHIAIDFNFDKYEYFVEVDTE